MRSVVGADSGEGGIHNKYVRARVFASVSFPVLFSPPLNAECRLPYKEGVPPGRLTPPRAAFEHVHPVSTVLAE